MHLYQGVKLYVRKKPRAKRMKKMVRSVTGVRIQGRGVVAQGVKARGIRARGIRASGVVASGITASGYKRRGIRARRTRARGVVASGLGTRLCGRKISKTHFNGHTLQSKKLRAGRITL